MKKKSGKLFRSFLFPTFDIYIKDNGAGLFEYPHRLK